MSDLKDHYRDRFRQFGDTHDAVQYSDKPSQERRFHILADVFAGGGDAPRVIDVGCGLGHMHDVLRAMYPDAEYLGLDFVPEFIARARETHAGNARARFEEFDLRNAELPAGYDYAVLSGVFNNAMPDNEAFMLNGIEKMFCAAGKAIAFNALSTYVDYQSEGLFYSDPCRVFDFCKRKLSRKVTLRHDYIVKPGSMPYEYTMFVFK